MLVTKDTGRKSVMFEYFLVVATLLNKLRTGQTSQNTGHYVHSFSC